MGKQKTVCLSTWILTAALTAATLPAFAQKNASHGAKPETGSTETHINQKEAKELFALVDNLMKFSSTESGLPIQSKVKRQLTTRTAVESYLQEKFDEDGSAKRLQRGEIVLKKFGLLDKDFELKPFLVALLKEQIEAYYDSKTKTINLLDWVDVDEQKPVMAHELTHALQDQHVDLEKWNDQTPDTISSNYAEDKDRIQRDELDTARDAVAEGQATAVMTDYVLKPMGKSLINNPEVMDLLKEHINGSDDSPILARAPFMLSESLLFPYRDGLSFEQDIWMDMGQEAAFAGTLDRPPTSSWEILNPLEYEAHHIPSIPLLPDIHPLTDPLYKPYDIGQMGQLDVHILAEIFGGNAADRTFTPAWNGGIYWAGQKRSATTATEQASTNSLALFYLSAWKNEASAQAFAQLYADRLGKKYSALKVNTEAQKTIAEDVNEQDFTTSEGPVVITTRGKLVFVAESFPLPLARKLTALILDAQGSGDVRTAQSTQPSFTLAGSAMPRPLTSDLVHFMANCGVMKAAVHAAIRATK